MNTQVVFPEQALPEQVVSLIKELFALGLNPALELHHDLTWTIRTR